MPSLSEPSAAGYCCPDETHPISPAIHLGRLASFYPKCRQCPHRDQTGTLSTGLVKMLTETRRRIVGRSLFAEEGVAGVYLNELSPVETRQLAAAFGLFLSRQSAEPLGPVALAGDGRALAPELAAAAADGLRRSGCKVVDLGASTAASLAWALEHLEAAGGFFVGNAGGDANTVGLKLWGAAGRPISAGCELQAIRDLCEQEAERPKRAYGGLSRVQIDPLYLAGLQPYYHALRPLRFVLDTGCRPLVDYFRRLATAVACQMLLCREAGQGPAAGALHLGPRVVAEQAHFGVSIDGDGEACRFVDERGAGVTGEQTLLSIARHLLDRLPGAAIVVERGAAPAIVERLTEIGAKVVRSEPSRAAMDAAMRESGAIFGGGPSGRFWHGRGRPMADGLKTLSLVLTMLSLSDRPLSAVLE